LIAVFAVVGCKDEPKASVADATPLAVTASPVAMPSTPANGTPLPIEKIEAALNPQKLPPYKGMTGSIEGTITVIGDPAPAAAYVPHDFARCPAAEKVYGKTFREGAPLPDGSRPLADALVVITGFSDFVAETSPTKAITIDNCALSTRTIDMTFGQRIEIKNKDKAVYALEISKNPQAALMVAPPGGDPVSVYPKEPGYSTLIERMQAPYMQADVYALMHPLHTVSGVDGHFRLDGIPVGKLTVNVRLSAINRDVSKEVEVLAGVVQKVDIQLEHRLPVDAGAPRVDGGGKPTLK
jgi:hypothetical protein